MCGQKGGNSVIILLNISGTETDIAVKRESYMTIKRDKITNPYTGTFRYNSSFFDVFEDFQY